MREVLEAALIITMLLVLSRKLSLTFSWAVPALILSVLFSWILAHYAYAITEAWGGTGQEWANALLYLLVIFSFIAIAWIISPVLFTTTAETEYLSSPKNRITRHKKLLFINLVSAVSLSLAREASEILIYLEGFLHQPHALKSALIGSFIGLGVGVSLGAITYYLFVFASTRLSLRIIFILLVFLCGGLSTQIARQLMQIGVLNSTTPLWNTSRIINEHSWLGELLYALFGYDSSPNSAQIIFYLIAVIPLLIILTASWRLSHK